MSNKLLVGAPDDFVRTLGDFYKAVEGVCFQIRLEGSSGFSDISKSKGWQVLLRWPVFINPASAEDIARLGFEFPYFKSYGGPG